MRNIQQTAKRAGAIVVATTAFTACSGDTLSDLGLGTAETQTSAISPTDNTESAGTTQPTVEPTDPLVPSVDLFEKDVLSYQIVVLNDEQGAPKTLAAYDKDEGGHIKVYHVGEEPLGDARGIGFGGVLSGFDALQDLAQPHITPIDASHNGSENYMNAIAELMTFHTVSEEELAKRAFYKENGIISFIESIEPPIEELTTNAFTNHGLAQEIFSDFERAIIQDITKTDTPQDANVHVKFDTTSEQSIQIVSEQNNDGISYQTTITLGAPWIEQSRLEQQKTLLRGILTGTLAIKAPPANILDPSIVNQHRSIFSDVSPHADGTPVRSQGLLAFDMAALRALKMDDPFYNRTISTLTDEDADEDAFVHTYSNGQQIFNIYSNFDESTVLSLDPLALNHVGDKTFTLYTGQNSIPKININTCGSLAVHDNPSQTNYTLTCAGERTFIFNVNDGKKYDIITLRSARLGKPSRLRIQFHNLADKGGSYKISNNGDGNYLVRYDDNQSTLLIKDVSGNSIDSDIDFQSPTQEEIAAENAAKNTLTP